MISHTLEDLRSAKRSFRGRLFDKAVVAHATTSKQIRATQCADTLLNVVGVSIGFKRSNGSDSPSRCVRVWVRRKLPRSALPRSVLIPKQCDGIETDVEEVGDIRFAADACAVPTVRQPRPFVCGVSISGPDAASGSLGYVVRRRNTSDLFVLTNYHVLFPVGDPISALPVYQPGSTDAPTSPTNEFAIATEGIPIRVCSPNTQLANRMDAAIAAIQPGSVATEICAVGKLRKGIAAPKLHMPVWMFGRSSKGVWGIIDQVDCDFVIRVKRTCAFFTGQISIAPTGNNRSFGKKGDSGSLIVTENGYAAGLFFAMDSRGRGCATPISRVLRHFDLTID